MIRSSDLTKVWAAPDNSRLTSKQYSFRFPVHVAAKLAALEEMYPNKSRTELVGDLLAAALDEVERSFPVVKGRPIGKDAESGEELFEDAGMSARFRNLVDKHYVQIEKEMGNDSAKPIYDGPGVVFASELEQK